jgi:hypothetical protein
MGKSNHPDYKVPIPFIPETEKDLDEGEKNGFDETDLRYKW